MTTELTPDMIREWRGKAGLSQAQAAEVVGASLRTFSNWERGRGRPQMRNLARLRAEMGPESSDAPYEKGFQDGYNQAIADMRVWADGNDGLRGSDHE